MRTRITAFFLIAVALSHPDTTRTRCEQAITNKRIEETITPAVGEANTRAMLNTNLRRN